MDRQQKDMKGRYRRQARMLALGLVLGLTLVPARGCGARIKPDTEADNSQMVGDDSETERIPQKETETAAAETVPSTEEVRIPCGILLYVNVPIYGERQEYYDESGTVLGGLEHGARIEVLSLEEELAPFYRNEDYEIGYIPTECLAESILYRPVRPAVRPAVDKKDAGEIWIHIVKSERVLELMSDDEVIAVYSVGLGGWPYDPKEQKGDGRTPEGTYYVCLRNASSRFYRALGISYPNKEDAARGYQAGLISKKDKKAIDAAINAGNKPSWSTRLGGEIEIHGERDSDGAGSQWDWTAGCIAVENDVIDILWEYCDMGTTVVIEYERMD